MRTQHRHRGFTLVEVIAASVILSGAVMLVGGIGTQAMIGTKLNRRYEMAVSLVDRQLSLIDYLGIDAFMESGQTEGDSQDLGFSFHWRVDTEYQELDSLYLVRMTVTWVERNRPYSFTIDTLLNGEALTEDAQGDGSQGTGGQ
jgi:prepilin-type N-terminal cleavage/methylation domain-containing protein